MPSLKPADPLLAIARFVLGFLIVVLALAAGALVLAAPVVLAAHGPILAELAKQGSAPGMEVIWALMLVMLCAAGLLALAVWFLVLLRPIVDSVGEGDPFVPANAERLARMGWIAIAGQVASIPFAALGAYIVMHVKSAHVSGGISLTGLLLALVLFILARVFREGTRMREELEGTV